MILFLPAHLRRIQCAPACIAILCLCLTPIPAQPSATPPPKRIISLAPGITETLFVLGIGNRLVGVTSYCDYPPEARAIVRIGGLYDPNFEAMLALKPDLAILLDTQRDAAAQLGRLGVATLAVDHQNIADIRQSILAIGKACGVEQEADAEVARIDSALAALRTGPRTTEPPRVLLTIGRDFAGDRIEQVYIAGRNNFYNEIIELAGGRNAYELDRPAYPMLTSEALIRINPQVIVELLGEDAKSPEAGAIRQQWSALPQIEAVARGRIHTIRGYHTLRPGPRFTQFAAELRDILRTPDPAQHTPTPETGK